MLRILTAALFLALSTGAMAQDSPPEKAGRLGESLTYLLGPDDQLSIRVVDAVDFSDKPIRISTTGYVTLPMIGSVRAVGLTVEQLETELVVRLRKYFTEPEVSVTRMEMRSQPVSVMGAVTNPGVQELKGRKTLVEILSMAGGIREDAGYRVRITRRLEWGRIPLSNAVDDSTGEFSIAEVPLRDLTEGTNPAANILIMPNDAISVPKAEVVKPDMVYVIGEVGKSGGIALTGQHPMTVLQAVSMAEGFTRTAKPKEARIMRLNPGSAKRDEVLVDVKAMLAGKTDDVTMQANDILVIPGNEGSKLAVRALETALQVGTGIAILSVR